MSQVSKALKMLEKAGKHGVHNYDFANAQMLRYGAYIKDLRDDGYTIITERVKLPNGRSTNVWRYTLVED